MRRMGSTDSPSRSTSEPGGRASGPSRGGLSVNWAAFIGLGVVLGFVLGGLAHLLAPDASHGGVVYGARTSILFIAAFGALVGGLAGGLVGVVVDALLSRR